MIGRRALQLAALAGGAATAVGAGAVAIERRAVGRARSLPDPYADEPLGRLHTEGLDVLTSDGVTLHVEVDGSLDSPLTIVFIHGFTLSMDAFHFQRRELGDLGRCVFYDQRSHGASGHSSPAGCTIDRLGEDLLAVLQAVAPEGPVVLVGHSMGGMTILALADQHPELFGDRVVGVGLLSTSTGDMAKTIVGLPGWASRAIAPTVPQLAKLIRRRAVSLERNRELGGDLAFVITRYLSFGPPVAPSLVAFMERMLLHTPIQTMADFFDTFLSHDKLKALEVLRGVPVLISCGDRDTLTPAAHSELMATVLPDAELQILPGAGHMAKIDRFAEVNDGLRRLVARATQPRVDRTRAG
jgi:pimeloyl-ACP methyl ester carboxylesterase